MSCMWEVHCACVHCINRPMAESKDAPIDVVSRKYTHEQCAARRFRSNIYAWTISFCVWYAILLSVSTSPTQSLAMTVHNAAEWLEECLHSILAQTFTGRMELSIFNDASTVNHAPFLPRGNPAPPTVFRTPQWLFWRNSGNILTREASKL